LVYTIVLTLGVTETYMRTVIEFGYTAVMFDGVPSGLLEGLARGKIVERDGYSTPAKYKPSDREITVHMIDDPADDDVPLRVVTRLHKELTAEKEARAEAEKQRDQVLKVLMLTQETTDDKAPIVND
jgi:hypothetical protein